MGIDIHNLNFLAHAQDRGVRFEHTLAIGRQAVFVEPGDLEVHRRRRGLAPLSGPTGYFEPLLTQWYGAREADAVDASPYEGARLIHDMNAPWPAGSPEFGRFDAVLDFGCLEHVFNFPVAWRNCVDLCRVGGHVLHALPANNLSGHGFYQFSPELFFNLYQPERGFELLDVFFVQKADHRHWWRVASPMDVRRRVNLCNSHEVYMLVLARKLREPGELPPPQQSDYAQDEWLKSPGASGGMGPSQPRAGLRVLEALGLRDALRAGRERLRALARSGLDLPAPDYTRVDVATLIGRAS